MSLYHRVAVAFTILTIAIFTVLAVTGCSSALPDPPVKVTYTVTGSAPQVDVNYQGDEDGPGPPQPYSVNNPQRENGVALPYTRTVTIRHGGWAYLWAQNRDPSSGDETCLITVNSKPLVPSESDSGGGTVCTVGGAV